MIMSYLLGFTEAKKSARLLYFKKDLNDVVVRLHDKYGFSFYESGNNTVLNTSAKFYKIIKDIPYLKWDYLRGVVEAKGTVYKNEKNVKLKIVLPNEEMFKKVNIILKSLGLTARKLYRDKGSMYIVINGNNITYKIFEYIYSHGKFDSAFYRKWLGYY